MHSDRIQSFGRPGGWLKEVGAEIPSDRLFSDGVAKKFANGGVQ
jgi:hypothetical protein